MTTQNKSKKILNILEKISFLVFAVHVLAWVVLMAALIGGWLNPIVSQVSVLKFLVGMTSRANQYVGVGVNPIWLSVSATGLTMMMFTLRVLIIYLVYRLLKQITVNNIFNETNLRFVRWINYSFMGFIGLDMISAIIFKLVHNPSGALSNGHGLSFEVLAWFTIYVIYIVFEYGLQIQKDNDSII